jgi:putative ABC transport system substrate-binding protein
MNRRELIAALGTTALAPILLARAEQKAIPVIGYLASVRSPPGFDRGLGETGYVEGQNVAVEYRLAEGHYDQLAAMAADLVARSVALIVAIASPAAQAALNATSSIPIVFFTSGDPVADGLVASLSRPGGNLTGVTFFGSELVPKRLELLSELVPQARMFALLINPNGATAGAVVRQAQDAARAKGFQLHVVTASTDSEIDAAFATLLQLHANGLIVDPDGLFINRAPFLAALASHHAVPTIYGLNEFAWSGGLISYGPNQADAVRQAGIYAGRILDGAKPADLPVQQPTKFELVINLKTAKGLGLTVPQSLLARADEVIE